ncbi:DinB family protein [Mucilaginibacter sp.]|uniref:DinB family protein n=1 Tax=Mucilaginibacter sp. TaxID=1882438 RepID=UPI0026350C72|nr:DinB family protein [Mucilaginibacter sp.]MDB5030038.1 hypothetical protein [Mucilaginibacter sp.]
MTKSIEIIKMPRLSLVKLTEELTIEQLNKIPAGFNNNIAWNLAHMIAAQQGLCYRRAGIDTIIDEAFFMTYKPDTKPEKFIDAAELETIKELLISTIDQLEIDIKNNLFVNYTPWTTRYGVEINNINEAVNFLPFHDGLHVGYIMALKRAL